MTVQFMEELSVTKEFLNIKGNYFYSSANQVETTNELFSNEKES